MQPVANVSEQDQAMDIGNMHKKFDKDHACGSGDILVDRQTGILITILHNRSEVSAAHI